MAKLDLGCGCHSEKGRSILLKDATSASGLCAGSAELHAGPQVQDIPDICMLVRGDVRLPESSLNLNVMLTFNIRTPDWP